MAREGLRECDCDAEQGITPCVSPAGQPDILRPEEPRHDVGIPLVRLGCRGGMLCENKASLTTDI